jgi:hypothetical protein
MKRSRLNPEQEAEHLHRVRLEHVVPVREPLVLISQVQRSGGTLLSQLFDGHPQCHAHPYELKIGRPKTEWPRLDLRSPIDEWFDVLFEGDVRRHFLDGYTKVTGNRRPELKAGADTIDVFPFVFLPSLQRELFERCVAAKPVERPRDVFDCYLTSYFNAWLDNHNLYTGPKAVVTGFTPRLVMHEESVAAFFEAYPDGHLISLVREPKSWWVSARTHGPDAYGEMDGALTLWRRSAEAAEAARERHGVERVHVVVFEDLVARTEAVMRRLAASIGIDFLPTLLEPTFNLRSIRAVSVVPVRDFGIVTEPLRRHEGVLAADEVQAVDEAAGELYRRVAALSRRSLDL